MTKTVKKSSKVVDYLIVGGGVAGTTAAETIRQLDAKADITIVSAEPYRLYSRILLSKPNYFLGRVAGDSIWLKKEDWYREKNIHLFAGHSATALDAKNKTITLDDSRTLRYRKLLLAVGVEARRWIETEIPGANLLGVHCLRTLDDTTAIQAGAKTAKRVVCVGGAFTTFEACDLLRATGLDVTVVIREPHFWDPALDRQSGRAVEQALEKGGVQIVRNAKVAKVAGKRAVEGVVLDNGTKVPCEMVIVGIGGQTPAEWIKAAGVAVNRGIATSEFLQTNVADIWAAGDCAEFKDLILDETLQQGTWVNAHMQGKIAGRNMAGTPAPFRLVSFSTAAGFGLTVGFVGDVRAAGREVIVRAAPARNSYARLIVDPTRDELVGATFVNRTSELQPILRCIEKNLKVSPVRKLLSDPEYDVRLLAA